MDLSSVKLLFVSVIFISTLTNAFQFECATGIGNEQPPVVNDTAYGYKVYISIQGLNETLEAYELYNGENKTLFLSVVIPDDDNPGSWVRETITHDYTNMQTFVVNEGKKSCVVSDFNPNETYSLFGAGIEDGFKNPNYSYSWTGDYNYTKNNETVLIDGITAESYDTCLTFNNKTIMYKVKVFFSVPSWNSHGGKSIPLQLILETNQTTDDASIFKEGYYTYTFAAFQRDSKSDWMSSDLPHDIICPGRKDVVQFPTMTLDYSYSSKMVIPSKKKIFSMHTFYDYDDKFLRYDYTAQVSTDMRDHHFTVVHDYLAGLSYTIDRDIGNCSAQPINRTNVWDIDMERDKEHPNLYHMTNFVDRISALNLTYSGRHRNHEGVTLDSWMSIPLQMPSMSGDDQTVVMTFYYTTRDWSSGGLSPVPVMEKININRTVNGTYKFSDVYIYFSNIAIKDHSPHVFDVGNCYKQDMRKTYVLKFSAEAGKHAYTIFFDAAVQRVVAKAANVSRMRVSSHIGKEIGSSGENGDTSLYVSVSLYDKPYVMGDTVEMIPQVNLTTAISNLQQVVNDNRFALEFKTVEGESLLYTAFHDYFKERNTLYYNQPSPPPQPPTKQGLSTGSIVALSIGMALVGLIIGATFCHFRYKRGNRQFGYGIQD